VGDLVDEYYVWCVWVDFECLYCVRLLMVSLGVCVDVVVYDVYLLRVDVGVVV